MRVVIGMHGKTSPGNFASPSARFAAGVAARYGVGDAAMRSPQLSRVLRRIRHTAQAAGGRVTFAPHIDVRLASFGRTASDAHLVLRRDMVIAARSEHRPIAAASAEPMIQRGRRAVAARPISVAESSPLAPPSTQVPRVLRRRSVAPVEDAAPPLRDERRLRPPAQAPRPQQLSPVEVARLTDHIVHTIDRRIAAFRERQGRV